MVECIKTVKFNNNDFEFLKGNQYRILEEYTGTIVIEGGSGGYLVFSNGDFKDDIHDDYTLWFKKI